MKSKKFLISFLVVVFLSQIFQTFYFNRNYFSEKYDVSYWKDRFEHSQWQLPLSNRIIGDDGLFSYMGYRLINGDDPSKNNPETGPLGKYLIGIYIILFKNPLYYSLIFGFLSLTIFFLLTEEVLKDKITALFISVILFLDPLFFTQFWKSWVDIAQLFFLLLNVFCIFLLRKDSKKNQLLSILSGLSIGFFVQTKFPITFPLLFLLESVFLLKNKFAKEYLLYVLGFLIGIFLPYAQYFLLGHSVLDFFKLQKYILFFYKKSQLIVHFGSIFQVLFFGKFPLVSQAGLTAISEWWLLWPLSFLISVFAIFKLFIGKNKNILLKGLGLFLLSELLIFALIPSYPRYLVVVIPFCYIFLGYFIKEYLKEKYKIIFFTAVLLYGLINSFLFLQPKPDLVLSDFYYNFSHQYFKDIFKEDILTNSLNMDGDRFSYVSQKTMFDAVVRDIKITEQKRDTGLFSDSAKVKVEITYKTQDLGYFNEVKTIELVKNNSQWKVKWDWNILLNGFNPNYSVKTALIPGKRGSIVSRDGNILAEDKAGYLISVNPEKIDTKKENEMLGLIGKLTGMVPVRFQNTYLENPLKGVYIPLVTLYKDITETQRKELLSYSGLELTNYPARVYNYSSLDSSSIANTFYAECCTKIYSPYNYHGIAGVEKKLDSVLWGFNGGKIQILNKQGGIIRTIINKVPKNGQNVTLTL